MMAVPSLHYHLLCLTALASAVSGADERNLGGASTADAPTQLSREPGVAIPGRARRPDEETIRWSSPGPELGPHEFRLHKTGEAKTSGGNPTCTGAQVTVLSSGAETFDDSTGRWQSKSLSFRPTPSGATVASGGYEVELLSSCAEPGAVLIKPAQGRSVRSHVLGLYVLDPPTGRSARIATLRRANGVILNGNKVLHESAFEGLDADLVYEAAPDFFAQDVILKELPPLTPEDLSFSPDEARLAVVTEILDPAEVDVRVPGDNKAGSDISDRDVTLGNLKMGWGRSFMTGSDLPDAAMVQRGWMEQEGRHVLIESVPYALLASTLAVSGKVSASSRSREAPSIDTMLALPPRPAPTGQLEPMRAVARAGLSRGFVIDYVLVPTSITTPYTFLAGQTYLIRGSVWIQADVTFQAGAVIKFARGANLTVSGRLTSPSSGSCVLTAEDDPTVGEKLTTKPLAGTYAGTALTLYAYLGPQTIANLDIRHATEAIKLYTASTVAINNVKIIRCGRAIGAYYTTVNVSGGTWCDVTNGYYNYGSSAFYGGPGANLVGKQDPDADLLSTFDELTRRGTNPQNAFSRSASRRDGEFMLMGGGGGADSNARLELLSVTYFSAGNFTRAVLRVSNTPVDYTWDVYFAPILNPNAWQWVRTGPPDVGAGTTTHQYFIDLPGQPAQGYFQVFVSEDLDYDGIPDGYEVAVLKTLPGDPDSNSTRDGNGDGFPDYPNLGANGVTDGDEDFDADGLGNLYELQLGTNPLVAQSTTDSDGDGLPNWAEALITFYTGDLNPTPRGDSDGDLIPNLDELSTGTDPTYVDSIHFPPDQDEQMFVDNSRDPSFTIVSHYQQVAAAGGGGQTIPVHKYFPGEVTIGGNLNMAATATFHVDEDQNGNYVPGSVTTHWSVCSLNRFIQMIPDFPEPDSLDGSAYLSILTKATDLSRDIWAEVNENVLNSLRQRTLEYVRAVSTFRIAVEFRKIQRLQTLGVLPGGYILRVKRSLSVIHTQATRLTAVTIRYGEAYPSWFQSRYLTVGVRGVLNLGKAVTWWRNLTDLKTRFAAYCHNVRIQCDGAEPALLSITLQQIIGDCPGWSNAAKAGWGLIQTTPIFDPNPLGLYEGGGNDCN